MLFIIIGFLFIGNGKSHYIKKELRHYFQDRSVIITLNESFNELVVIKQLQETLIKSSPSGQALYLNFTFVPPAVSYTMHALHYSSYANCRNLKVIRNTNSIKHSLTRSTGFLLTCLYLDM